MRLAIAFSPLPDSLPALLVHLDWHFLGSPLSAALGLKRRFRRSPCAILTTKIIILRLTSSSLLLFAPGFAPGAETSFAAPSCINSNLKLTY